MDCTGGVKAKLLRATAELTALDLGVSVGIALESHVCDMSCYTSVSIGIPTRLFISS